MTGFPVTLTLMGLGAVPASHPQFLGMLGMHGTYEANLAMHGCDVMVCIGARFDDRVTGRLNAFSPNAKKIHIDIDPSSINKNVMVDIGIVGDVGRRAGADDRGLDSVAASSRTARRWPPGGGRSTSGGPATRLPTASPATSSSRSTRSSACTS